ncbi:MAG: metallophosphoesterase [Gemmatimonadaceae bacterium]|nr:metallophosphoesterase [Acetobacteraceae bacterium]
MALITRRGVLRAGAGLLTGGAATAAYAVTIEPGFRLVVTRYDVALADWGDRPPLTICVTTDLHAGEPWMTMDRVHGIVDAANAVRPDLHVVLGDLPAHHRFVTRRLPMAAVARAMAGLRAPMGTFAILGNHDWWDDPLAHRGRPPAIRGLLEGAGVPVLANTAVPLRHGDGVWLLGTDSALAYGRRWPGADDLRAALAPVQGDWPAILLAHEPDIFPRVPARVGLTLSGHTHGGQVRVLGRSAVVPSRYGNRYAYGLVQERDRQLVVSAGLGCSLLPVRLGVPPELTVVRVDGRGNRRSLHSDRQPPLSREA